MTSRLSARYGNVGGAWLVGHPQPKCGQRTQLWSDTYRYINWAGGIIAIMFIVSPHCMHSVDKCWLLTLQMSLAWSVSVCIGHDRKPCKNGWTDRNAGWTKTHIWTQWTMLYMGYIWASPGEDDWTVCARWP